MSRNTVQKKIILDSLKKFNTHPGVEEVYTEIVKDHPSISKATVYRNLKRLVEEDEILQISVTDDVSRFDGCADLHYHFKCKQCNGIFDLDLDSVQNIEQQVSDTYGYQVDRHDIIFTGTCINCLG